MSQNPQFKQEAVVDVNEQYDAESRSDLPGSITTKARVPWLGFSAMFGVVIAVILAFLTLAFSHDVSSTKWPKMVAPNVILAGINAFTNICLAIAIGQGVTIAWWRKAAQGATIQELHRSWGFSTSIKEVVLGIKHFNVIALAALALKVAIVDSILLQRATSTYTETDPGRTATMLGVAAHRFPSTGVTLAHTDIPAIDAWYWDVIKDWQNSNGFFSGEQEWFSGCDDGVCFASIEAAGFEVTCDTPTSTTSEIGTLAQDAYPVFQTGNATDAELAAIFDVPAFVTTWGVGYDSDDDIILKLNYTFRQNKTAAEDDTLTACPSTLTKAYCTFRPAIVQYPITIQNSTSTHASNGVSLGWDSTSEMGVSSDFGTAYNRTHKQLVGYNITGYPNNSALQMSVDILNTGYGYSTIGGLLNAMISYYTSNTTLTYTDAISGWAMTESGSLTANQIYTAATTCDVGFHDPISYITLKLNELSFATSILNMTKLDGSSPIDGLVANITLGETIEYYSGLTNATVLELPGARLFLDRIHYATDFRYMAGALASMLLCVLLVIPSYWGWRDLPHDLSLGPFEIANAFQAPILARADTATQNMGVKSLMKEVGKTKVQYGVMTTGPQGRLAIAEPEKVLDMKVAKGQQSP